MRNVHYTSFLTLCSEIAAPVGNSGISVKSKGASSLRLLLSVGDQISY